ncbi:MAG TPA: GAF domain-containing protein [Candidatus Deferrimicrobiaceae bacterium]|nr:GAF domain-containing protein [Candidatus Deferrimicrobiaceae bacterium]
MAKTSRGVAAGKGPALRPLDATLSVTRAADVLGVHPNTIRTWSDAGRLRYYRINPRGDRRYRLGDLRRFLAAHGETDAESAHPRDRDSSPSTRRRGRTVPLDQHEAILALDAALTAILGSLVDDALADPFEPLNAAARAIRSATRATRVSIWQQGDDGLTSVASSGVTEPALVTLPTSLGVLGQALASAEPVEAIPARHLASTSREGREVACAIPGRDAAWGVLLVVHRTTDGGLEAEHELVRRAAAGLGSIVRASSAIAEVSHQLHRADALRRVANDIGSRLDLDEILDRLVNHAAVLFGADRAAVYLVDDGGWRTGASFGLSRTWIAAAETVESPTLGDAAIAARRPLFAVGYRDDPRVGGLRAAVIQEGIDTACVAPLLDGDRPEPFGLLSVYHDRPHPWTADELETMAALATQATVAIKTARNYTQLATWAAQLQSIQQLGARLNLLTSVPDIGQAIATELRQLIDYHNVRVYRLYGDDLVPVAMLGQVGEYEGENPEQLRVKFGQGITGWVAEHRVAQRLDDAANDPRANTIPGTEDDLDESMLLAPMTFEDQVLGVLVLSKLGLRQFRQDDLRLLEIYASFAAQAMANADATELLRRQSAALEQKVRGQRELLRVSESILVTLDPDDVLDTVSDRLGELVGSDTTAIELVDQETGLLTPVVARGRDAEYYLQPWRTGETGLATWVLERNEPVRVEDQFDDPRIAHAEDGPVHGSLVCVPLRGPTGAIGTVTLERTGEGRVFSDDEFELAQLFAAQASIALRNAETYLAVRVRAQTDVLTGLLNHGTFGQQLDAMIAAREPFSLVMLDLDEFKTVNDRMGHQAGDRLLREVADAIVAASRDTDRVFRYGGDEFVALLPRTGPDHVRPVAERIRAAVTSVMGPDSTWHARARRLNASAGTATYPVDGATSDEVLLAADRALFLAKRSGGGRVATATEGLALAGEFTLTAPTPIDPLASPAA